VLRSVVCVAVVLLRPLVADGQAVTVTLTPDSAILGPNDSAISLVTVRNTGNTPVRALRLSVLPSDAARAAFDVSAVRTLAGGAVFTTTFRIHRAGDALQPATAVVRADGYTGAGPTTAILTTTPFHVSAGAYAAPEQVADVQIAGGGTTVTSRDHSIFYVVVRNKTDSTIAIGPVTTASTEFSAGVDSSAHLGADHTASIAARSTASVPMYMTANSAAKSGKETLVVTVPVHWTVGHTPVTGTVVSTHDVDVGVWGESDLLRVLGIPSFLVLPGFLMLVTFGLLWKLHPPFKKAGAFSLSAMTPEFWLFGVTISGLFAIAATWTHVDAYLYRYSIGDVAQVWLLSIAIAAAVYGVWTGLGWLHDSNDAAHLHAITPLATDDARTVLRRLAADGRPIPTVERTVATTDQLFELRVDPADSSKVWVSPGALTKWLTDAANKAEADDRARLDDLRGGRDPTALADFLDKYVAALALSVRWNTVGTNVGPALVDRKDVTGRFSAFFVDTE
jgi:hypothetical protein